MPWVKRSMFLNASNSWVYKLDYLKMFNGGEMCVHGNRQYRSETKHGGSVDLITLILKRNVWDSNRSNATRVVDGRRGTGYPFLGKRAQGVVPHSCLFVRHIQVYV